MNHAGIRSALSRIAWAYLLIHLHFRLNNLDLLPDWAGYLLIFSAIGLLAGELRDLPLLRPFCILLGAVSGVDWLSFLLTGAEFTGRFFLLSALITCVALYFHFQLLTDLAALADRRSGEGGRSSLGRRLRLCRNADAVFRVAFCLLYGVNRHCRSHIQRIRTNIRHLFYQTGRIAGHRVHVAVPPA